MDIRKIMKGEATMEEFGSQLLDLDSEFRFKCRKCGKCCKHQNTILFTARDIFNIAKKLNMSTEDVINRYAETYIGSASRTIPRKSFSNSFRKGRKHCLLSARNYKETVADLRAAELSAGGIRIRWAFFSMR